MAPASRPVDERWKEQRRVETRVASAWGPPPQRPRGPAALERPARGDEGGADGRPPLRMGVEEPSRPVRRRGRARHEMRGRRRSLVDQRLLLGSEGGLRLRVGPPVHHDGEASLAESAARRRARRRASRRRPRRARTGAPRRGRSGGRSDQGGAARRRGRPRSTVSPGATGRGNGVRRPSHQIAFPRLSSQWYESWRPSLPWERQVAEPPFSSTSRAVVRAPACCGASVQSRQSGARGSTRPECSAARKAATLRS